MTLQRLAATGAAIIMLAAPVAAQDLPALHRVTDVAAWDVLNIRAAPSAQAPILGTLAPTQTGVEVTGLSPDGRWARVNTGETAGWAALRFLTPQGGPGWRSGQASLSCFGTEPFWGLSLFFPGSQAEFVDPSSGGFNLVTDAGALPTTVFPPTLAVPFSGARQGMAVIRAADCSDGMSDMAYGLEVQVYWRGQTDALSGCCSLAR